MDKQYIVTTINDKKPVNGNITIDEFDGDFNNLTNKPSFYKNHAINTVNQDIIMGQDNQGIYYETFE